MDHITLTMAKGKVDATTAFLLLCEGKGWEQHAVETTEDMPTESFRWLCSPSGWRAKQVDVRAFFEDAEQTRFEVRGKAKDTERVAAALREA